MKSDSANLNRNIIQMQSNQNMHHQQLAADFQASIERFQLAQPPKATKDVIPASMLAQAKQNYEKLPNQPEFIAHTVARPTHPSTNPHVLASKQSYKASFNPNRQSLNHSTICNFIELPNGERRGSETERTSMTPRYYSQHHQPFQTLHNRSPI